MGAFKFGKNAFEKAKEYYFENEAEIKGAMETAAEKAKGAYAAAVEFEKENQVLKTAKGLAMLGVKEVKKAELGDKAKAIGAGLKEKAAAKKSAPAKKIMGKKSTK